MNDKIEKRVEEFEEEEKTVERMVEMLKFMDENEWIDNDTIEEVVGNMLDLEEVAKIMKKEKIEYFRRNLSETWDRDTWEEDMKIEASEV